MRIIHTADLQLGYRQYGFVARERDFYEAAAHVYTRAHALSADAIIIAGDLFDMTKPPGHAVKFMQGLVGAAKAYGTITYGIDGNHDMSGCSWLEVCGIVPLSPEPIEIGTEGITIAGLNSCRPSVFKQQLDGMISRNIKADVFVLHQSIAEMSDFPVQELTALELSGKFHELGTRYVAMGDIHKYQETVIGGVRFCYSGSTERNAIDENADKSFSIVDITESDLKTAYEPIPIRPTAEYTVTDQETATKLMEHAVAETDARPLFAIWYVPEMAKAVKEVEAVLQRQKHLYLTTQIANADDDTIDQARKTFERRTAMAQLKAAILAFFEEPSDEYQLILQLLDAPSNVEDTVMQYLRDKGVVEQ
jgi:DNA repair exonuclease SbcCD nuclease subunit